MVHLFSWGKEQLYPRKNGQLGPYGNMQLFGGNNINDTPFTFSRATAARKGPLYGYIEKRRRLSRDVLGSDKQSL